MGTEAGQGTELPVPMISSNKKAAQQYHTHRCSNFPDDVRPLGEGDRRRSISKCSACRSMEEP